MNFRFAPLSLLVILPLLLAPGRAQPRAPLGLTVNGIVDPVGTDALPQFAWQVDDPSPGAIQTRYQIRVASSEVALTENHAAVWDSGVVESRRQSHITYAGPALAADGRYYWQVRTWDGAGRAGAYSAPAALTVGLLANEDWAGAAWIRRDSTEADDHTYYRKEVMLPQKPVRRATAYIAAMHKYVLHVNGAQIGQGPAHHYPQYQYYNAWDITSQLTAGGPAVFGVLTHWYGGGQGRPAGERGLLFKAVIHYQDGTTVEVGSDGTWRQSPALAWHTESPVHRRESEGVGYVEEIDARHLSSAWTRAGFADAAWAPVTVVGPPPTAPWTGRLAPDLSRIEESEIVPVAIHDRGDGRCLVDFGKVYAGMPRLTFPGGMPGARVRMHGGFALTAAGEIDPTQNQGTNLDYVAVLTGGEFVFAPMTPVGFRYLMIERAPMAITDQNCRFVVRHSRMAPEASSFASSDPTLDAVWGLMKHTLTVTAQEQFWDTATREKGGFLADSIWQSLAAMPVMGERVLTRRALGEFLQSMEQFWSAPADRGRMNAVYPNGDGARDIPDNTQTYLVWVWEYFMQTGDRDFLRSNYARLRDIADNVQRARNETTGLITRLPGGDGQYLHGIIDWPPSMRFGYDVDTSARTVVNALAWADDDVMARIAAEVGETADRDAYRARADALQEAINRRLLTAAGVYCDGLHESGTASPHCSQHANSLPLALGLVPPANRAAVVARVKELKMSVGMETVWWLIRALGEADQGESLYTLLTDPTAPGWARSLARGATTTWESWFADEERNNSTSHGWGAIGLRAYTDYVLGIQALRPQFEQVQIRPLDFGSKLAAAHGTLPTERGPIAVDWKRAASGYRLSVSLPANLTAVVFVPAGVGDGPVVKVDGVPVVGVRSGRYLGIPGIGSGTHVFEREFAVPSAKAGERPRSAAD